VILVRPTKSRPLYAQMVGRVTRPKDGKKGVIIDYPWVSGKHSLIKPTELFDRTGATDEVYKIAEELLDGMKTDDLLDAIEQAEEIQVERRKYRVKVSEKKVNYRRVSYDPLAVGDVLGLPMRQESDSALRNRATPKQVELLAKFGIMCGHAMSKRRASKMLDIVFGRMKQGLCTIKQCACLIANDVDPDEARSMSKVDASIRIGQLIGR
jgi:type I site-specific restriction endonuclease